MLHRTRKTARIAFLSILFAAVPLAVQADTTHPMDMSSAIRSPVPSTKAGQANATEAANIYVRYMQQLRAKGDTGPSLRIGGHCHLDHSPYRRQFRNYMDYDMHALRGCKRPVDQDGRVSYAC